MGSRGRVGRGSTQLHAESILEEALFPTVLLVCLMACTSLGKEGCGHRAAHAPSLPVQHQQTDGLLKHGGVCLDSSAGKSLLFSVLLTPSLPPSLPRIRCSLSKQTSNWASTRQSIQTAAQRELEPRSAAN